LAGDVFRKAAVLTQWYKDWAVRCCISLFEERVRLDIDYGQKSLSKVSSIVCGACWESSHHSVCVLCPLNHCCLGWEGSLLFLIETMHNSNPFCSHLPNRLPYRPLLARLSKPQDAAFPLRADRPMAMTALALSCRLQSCWRPAGGRSVLLSSAPFVHRCRCVTSIARGSADCRCSVDCHSSV
jgi:hypothetical protein